MQFDAYGAVSIWSTNEFTFPELRQWSAKTRGVAQLAHPSGGFVVAGLHFYWTRPHRYPLTNLNSCVTPEPLLSAGLGYFLPFHRPVNTHMSNKSVTVEACRDLVPRRTSCFSTKTYCLTCDFLFGFVTKSIWPWHFSHSYWRNLSAMADQEDLRPIFTIRSIQTLCTFSESRAYL